MLRQVRHALFLGEILPDEAEGKPLSCDPGKTYERSASLRMASDSAAVYGQSR